MVMKVTIQLVVYQIILSENYIYKMIAIDFKSAPDVDPKTI